MQRISSVQDLPKWILFVENSKNFNKWSLVLDEVNCLLEQGGRERERERELLKHGNGNQ